MQNSNIKKIITELKNYIFNDNINDPNKNENHINDTIWFNLKGAGRRAANKMEFDDESKTLIFINVPNSNNVITYQMMFDQLITRENPVYAKDIQNIIFKDYRLIDTRINRKPSYLDSKFASTNYICNKFECAHVQVSKKSGYFECVEIKDSELKNYSATNKKNYLAANKFFN